MAANGFSQPSLARLNRNAFQLMMTGLTCVSRFTLWPLHWWWWSHSKGVLWLLSNSWPSICHHPCQNKQQRQMAPIKSKWPLIACRRELVNQIDWAPYVNSSLIAANCPNLLMSYAVGMCTPKASGSFISSGMEIILHLCLPWHILNLTVMKIQKET